MSAFICPVCSYVRYVNPTNRNEMSPGSTSTEPGIPTLDGLTDQQALERESGGGRKKPIIRSIGDPRLRSQYSSSAIGALEMVVVYKQMLKRALGLRFITLQ